MDFSMLNQPSRSYFTFTSGDTVVEGNGLPLSQTSPPETRKSE